MALPKDWYPSNETRPGDPAADPPPAPGTDPGDPQLGQWPGRIGSFVQGAVLQPIESAGTMVENIPRQGLPNWLQRAMAPPQLPKTVSDYLDQHRRYAEQHPGWNLGGQAAALLAAGGPRAGAGAVERGAINVGVGAGTGALEPVDKNDPDYWGKVGTQAGVSGVLAGGLGEVARMATERAGQASRAALNVFRNAYDRMGLGQYAPTELTMQTARQVRRFVGDRLGQIYQHMAFNPNMPGWLPGFIRHTQDVARNISDPALRERWATIMRDKAFRPLFQSDPASTRVPIVTGDILHQIMSKLSGEANQLGYEASRGGPNSMMIRQMQRGLSAIHDNIAQHIDRYAPAVAADRQAANQAYQLSDWMWRSSRASNRWIPGAAELAARGEKKFGQDAYTDPNFRFRPLVEMLEGERDLAERQAKRSRVGREVARIPFMLGGYQAGRLFGEPLAGAMIGGAIGREASPAVMGAAGLLGRYPALVGAGGGAATGGIESLMSPHAWPILQQTGVTE